jgi:hypothetical protein
MRTPQTYRVTGQVLDGVVVYYLVCASSTTAHHTAKEFWPELKIRDVSLLEEWHDAPQELAYA